MSEIPDNRRLNNTWAVYTEAKISFNRIGRTEGEVLVEAAEEARERRRLSIV